MFDRRRYPDRRRFSLRTFWYALGFGRRYGPRRAAEQRAPYYVDVYGDMSLLIWSVGILGSCALDALLTLIILDRGGVEINPVMAFLLTTSPPLFFAVKYLVTAAAVVFIVLHWRFKLGGISGHNLLSGLFLAYVVLIGYEWWLLFG
ncbi:MAG: DUF5658 family protein [Methylohalobius sp.]|nr:DUF5658 family protein [Methylohalobius sp.]